MIINFHNLTNCQWLCAERVAALLAPFEEVTRSVSSETFLLSQIIPTVRALRSILSTNTANTDTLRTFLLESLDTRFHDLDSKPLYTCATFLDPRLKDRCFSEATQVNIKAVLQARHSSED